MSAQEIAAQSRAIPFVAGPCRARTADGDDDKDDQQNKRENNRHPYTPVTRLFVRTYRCHDATFQSDPTVRMGYHHPGGHPRQAMHWQQTASGTQLLTHALRPATHKGWRYISRQRVALHGKDFRN